jgi:hypothetical protein
MWWIVEAIPFLSPSIARGMLLTIGLLVIIVVLILVHEASRANDSHDRHCPPSSCGNIDNISYPFRLKGDPPICSYQGTMFPTVYYPSMCTDVYDQVVYGFKLSWIQVLCHNFTGDDFCYLNNVNFPVQCGGPPRHGA